MATKPMKSLPKKWEGSKADRAADRKGAKRDGETLKVYERSAADQKADAKAQAKLNKERKALKAKRK